MPKANAKPTWTFLTEQSLRKLDDFATLAALRHLTGGTTNQISAALFSLKKFGVVDCIEAEGSLWWFLTGEDHRQRHLEERVPEEQPRKPRMRRKLIPPR